MHYFLAGILIWICDTQTTHTSVHNDLLWKTGRYSLQPFQIKSYSNSSSTIHQLDAILYPIRHCSMERIWMYANACLRACVILSVFSVHSMNFPCCLRFKHLSIQRNCYKNHIPFRRSFIRADFPMFRSVSFCHFVDGGWKSGEVTLGCGNGKLRSVDPMRYGTVNTSQGIWFNSTSNERSCRISKCPKYRAWRWCLFIMCFGIPKNVGYIFGVNWTQLNGFSQTRDTWNTFTFTIL